MSGGVPMDGGFGDHVIAQTSWTACAARADVIEAAERRHGDGAPRWLAKPHARLDGMRPQDLLETEDGCIRVMRLLDAAHRW
jgi:uncharacterized protein (DUF2384 family)